MARFVVRRGAVSPRDRWRTAPPRGLPLVLAFILGSATLTGCVGGVGLDPGSGPLPTASIPATPPPVSGPAIRGSATDTRGRAAAGASVTVTKVLRTGERLSRDAKAWMTLGLGCLDAQGCSAPTQRTLVAADGHFAVPVPRGVTEHDGLAVTVLAARGEGARVQTTLMLPASANSGQTLQNVPLAADAPTLERAGNREILHPPAVPGAGNLGVTLRQLAAPGADGAAITSAETDASRGFDRRVLEDGRALLVSRQTGTSAGLPALYSTSLVVTGHAVPPSRGAGCVIEGSRGQNLVQQTCGLTDGNLDHAWTPQDDPACTDGPCPGTLQSSHRDVTVLLPHRLNATLLVVRGCGFTCRIRLSLDGRTFGSGYGPPSGDTSDLYVLPLPASPVAAVRVETATGGFFDSLREVSVYP
jgi:hypothetical protein